VQAAILATALSIAAGVASATTSAEAIIVGLDAEVSHATSTADDAIRVGMQIAVEEINAAGGPLGRPMAVEVRDNRSVPWRGVENAVAFGADPRVVAFVTGKFSPVVLEQLKPVHESRLILLDAWAAADGITRNGYKPNFAFRLGLNDTMAITALMLHAQRRGLRRPGLFLPNNSWGRSCLEAAEKQARSHGLKIAGVEWYQWGDRPHSFSGQYEKLAKASADHILMVANEGEGAQLLKDVAVLPKSRRLPVLSHWGILGSNFTAMAGPALREVDLRIVTTISYATAQTPRARTLLEEAARRLGSTPPQQLTSAIGVAHAYDLVHLLALAIRQAGSTDRDAVRLALENISGYNGAMKRYQRPFSASRREALDIADLRIVRYGPDGALLPHRSSVP
jgi:branched-chain amino acid transport system substrate-binding protein